MDPAHELGGGKIVSKRAQSRRRRISEEMAGGIALQRQVYFWLAPLAVVVLALWLLSPILLPFVAGAAIAYLLKPVTDRLERYGVNLMFTAPTAMPHRMPKGIARWNARSGPMNRPSSP